MLFLSGEMIQETVKIVNEAIKDKIRVNLIINNRTAGNAALLAQKIADRLPLEKEQKLLSIHSYPSNRAFDSIEPPSRPDEY